ncbi:MAG: DUF2914 domain-containing protein [Myxococcota bacterium]
MSIRDLWHRWPMARSVLFLGLGSAWDAATLTRIDRWSDQALLAAYQLGLVALTVVQLRHAHGRPVPRLAARRPEWVHLASQFLLGGLLSAFTVYYVRGAASARAAVFGGLLAALLVANELVERPLQVAEARLALLAFAVFNGLLFVLPILTGHLLPSVLVAGLALAVVASVLIAVRPGTELVVRGMGAAATTLAVVCALVWLQVLPPLPLSLHRIGVFHQVEHRPDGYALTWEPQRIVGRLFWRYDRVFRRSPGEAVWCFSSVFAPTGLALDVVHHWDRLGPTGWEELDQVPLAVAGGRGEGFRTFSRKENVPPGWWRVRVTLDSGRELGRVLFQVVDAPTERPRVTQVF